MSEEAPNVRAVFLAAKGLTPADRPAFLDGACPDPAFRRRLHNLLRRHDELTREFSGAEGAAESSIDVGSIVDEFRILSRIDGGGMGVVYVAEDLILQRGVAFKVLADHLLGSDEAIRRFRVEAQLAATLKHPRIVPVHRFGFFGKQPFIVTELVEGKTLRAIIDEERGRSSRKDGRAWFRLAAEVAAAVAEALDYSHRRKVIHRDVKPSNILVDDEHGARLTDFGIATMLTEPLPAVASALVGTYQYMSPEHVTMATNPLDGRSDIFSLGIVLYEMLTLQRPFEGDSPRTIMAAISSRRPAPVRTVARRVERDLETICHKALEKDPLNRYQSAAHMAADLSCYLENKPILAQPPGRVRRVLRWTHARRRGMTAGAAALSAVGTVAAWRAYAWRAEQFRRAAHCHVTVLAPPDADVLVHKVHPETFEVDRAVYARMRGEESAWLTPGSFRFVITTPDGRASERDVFLHTPGAAIAVDGRARRAGNDARPMVLIPAGRYTVGRPEGEGYERLRTLECPAFWIDTTEVSNGDYRRFVEETGWPPPRHWRRGTITRAHDSLPVVGIRLQDMQEYAIWAGKRLPTAPEWECAARYPDARLHPWGDAEPPEHRRPSEQHRLLMQQADWDAGASVYLDLARPVVEDPAPAPTGIKFLFSNAREMTSSIATFPGTAVLCKGGSWMDSVGSWDLSRTVTWPHTSPSMTIGFRCARSAVHMPAKEDR